jgi:thymidine kinase
MTWSGAVPAPRPFISLTLGPMKSSKSSCAVLEIEQAQLQRLDVLVLTHAIDTRFAPGGNAICSHSKHRVEAHGVDDTTLVAALDRRYDLVVLDEIQFFGIPALLCFVARAADLQCGRLSLFGLDTDFMLRPFESVTALFAVAHHIEKRLAVCELCRGLATLTIKRQSGESGVDGERIQVGGDELYYPACRACALRVVTGTVPQQP